MELFGTVRRNVECSIRITRKDTTSTTKNYGPYIKFGRREKMHKEFVESRNRTKCNREDNTCRRKDYRGKNLRAVGGGCYSLKVFFNTGLL
jgi:hypothetical protein